MTGIALAEGDGKPEIVLDLSRLLARLLRTTPTGVDRVELRYAQTLLERVPERLAFGARFPRGVYGRLDPAAARRFTVSSGRHSVLEAQRGEPASLGRSFRRLAVP